jgi:hypothetical protein
MRRLLLFVWLLAPPLRCVGQGLDLTDPALMGQHQAAAAGGGGSAATPDIVWYRFDGSGTNLPDSSTGGTAGATLADSAARVSGSPANAIQGNGTSYQARSTGQVTYGTNIITVVFWLKRANASGDAFYLMNDGSFANQSLGAFWIKPESSGGQTLRAAVFGNSGYLVQHIADAYDGGWHHFSIVIDNSTTAGAMTWYKDGSAYGGTITTETNSKDASWEIGQNGTQRLAVFEAWPNVSFALSGTELADLRIYSGAMAAADVTAIYNAALHP